ncbi:MAG: carotenoid oxygenase family protein [Leptolyngbyaceae cyanobacterium T60_A2020_046]|nr:carotenoid oxygenase family protein [Leptolyngbyaceae cyanobacterium T60_A2020_046]
MSPQAVPHFPEAAMISTRQECEDVVLKVVEGSLPTDLRGHWFAMGPVGSVAMTPPPGEPHYPGSDGTSLFNGDALLHRFDCDRLGEVRLTRRLLKTPCYYADRFSTLGTRFSDLKFFSSGLARFSFLLGFRDEVNTAAIPVKFATDDRWRLLVSWDAGRPYEIDPVSLQVITPVGRNDEWREQSVPLRVGPFKLVTTATHHAYDDHSQELFTINFGKSLLTMIAPILVSGAGVLARLGPIAWLIKWLFRIVIKLLQFLNLLLYPVGRCADFVYVLRWNGQDDFDRWQVMLPRTLGLPIRRPVQIEQSMHQVGITRNYVVLMDTSFKLGPEQLIPNPLPGNTNTERVLREVLNFPQFPNTNVYVVKRSDLTGDRKTVIAQKVTIRREIAHFRVDYDDSNGVVLHVAHNNAWDAAEWPQGYDDYVKRPKPNPPFKGEIDRVVGMTVTTTDLNYLGRYVIEPDKGKIKTAQLVSDPTCTWAPAIYADIGNLGVPDRYDHIYWINWGCWPDLMTQFMASMYRRYKYRQMPLQQVVNAASSRTALPALCHLDTTTMKIVDNYVFPQGHFGNSPQFIPRGDSGDQTDGYITCVVFADYLPGISPDHPNHGSPTSQIWIFDAQNLAQGPVCKLGFPEEAEQLGLTIHTTWVPEILPRTASYHIPIQADYDPLIKDSPEMVKRLFRHHVYPHFE